jgi:hypothetical protein
MGFTLITTLCLLFEWKFDPRRYVPEGERLRTQARPCLELLWIVRGHVLAPGLMRRVAARFLWTAEKGETRHGAGAVRVVSGVVCMIRDCLGCLLQGQRTLR